MQPRAGGTGEGCKAPSLLPQLLLKMRLYVHARLGALKNDQLRHRDRMKLQADFIFDLDQFWMLQDGDGRATKYLAIAKGPAGGPFRCHQRR